MIIYFTTNGSSLYCIAFINTINYKTKCESTLEMALRDFLYFIRYIWLRNTHIYLYLETYYICKCRTGIMCVCVLFYFLPLLCVRISNWHETKSMLTIPKENLKKKYFRFIKCNCYSTNISTFILCYCWYTVTLFCISNK